MIVDKSLEVRQAMEMLRFLGIEDLALSPASEEEDYNGADVIEVLSCGAVLPRSVRLIKQPYYTLPLRLIDPNKTNRAGSEFFRANRCQRMLIGHAPRGYLIHVHDVDLFDFKRQMNPILRLHFPHIHDALVNIDASIRTGIGIKSYSVGEINSPVWIRRGPDHLFIAFHFDKFIRTYCPNVIRCEWHEATT